MTNHSAHSTQASGPAPQSSPLSPQSYVTEDEIDIIRFIRIIWHRRWMVVIVMLLAVAAGSSYALLATEKYRAEAVLVPAGGDAKGGAQGGLMSAFGGLASMAGVSLGGGGSVEENLAVLTSRDFISKFIKEHKLKAHLTSDDLSDWKLHRLFVSMLDVQWDQRSGLIRMAITWRDPGQAAAWLNSLISSLNDHLREAAIERSRENLKYLHNELSKTQIQDMRMALYDLIAQEQKHAMVANTQQQFAFRVLDEAVPPEQRDSPKRKKIVIISLIVGIFLGLLLVFLLEVVVRLKNSDEMKNSERGKSVVHGE